MVNKYKQTLQRPCKIPGPDPIALISLQFLMLSLPEFFFEVFNYLRIHSVKCLNTEFFLVRIFRIRTE